MIFAPAQTPLERLLAPALDKRPSVVMFDWDNTLFDQDGVADDAYYKLISQLGRKDIAITPDDIRREWYKNKESCCQQYFPDSSVEEVKSVFGALMKQAPRRLLDQEAVMSIIQTLHEKGIPMAVVSNKEDATLKSEIGHFGLTSYFQVIRGDLHDKKLHKERAAEHALKPDPRPIVHTLRAIGLPLHNAWFIGDTFDDAGAARSDGFQRFHLGHKHRDSVKKQADPNDRYGDIIYLDDLCAFRSIVDHIPAAHSSMAR